jgi:hypothetical protein
MRVVNVFVWRFVSDTSDERELTHAVTYNTPEEDDHTVLEDAFTRFNVGDESDPVVQQYREAGNPSLSVNDVVVIGANWYKCKATGWEELDLGWEED